MMKVLCSIEVLRNAVTRGLSSEEEAALHAHLEHCESCCAQLEQLAGGEAWRREAAELLSADELDAAIPEAAAWSEVDFSVEHLDPSDDASVLGQLGGYDVLAIVGRGGMGVVLKAFDRELKRLVAIKVLAPHLAHSSVARKRFAREAQAAAAVVNPHVIAIHHVQPTGRLPFLIMPLLTGESLAQRLKSRGPLELTEVLRIGMQAAAGLAAAHDQGLVHRDVKPANIFLEKGVERVVITDFGLARAADDVSMTRQGVVAGTPEYMSPEQAHGEALDSRSDLFSLGCVLYEMATGVSPFRTDSTMATWRRIVDEQPAAMASFVPELPPWFNGIVERLLSKDPAQRFASASEVSQLLERCLSHLQQPTAVTLPISLLQPRAVSVSKRHKNLFTGVLVMFATLVLGLVAMFAFQGGSPPAISGDSLDGIWEVVLEPDTVEPPDDQRHRFVFAGEWYAEFRGSARLSVSRFKVDPEHTPKRISLVDGEGKPKRGIYEAQGDRLRLSPLAIETDALPTQFGPDLKRANGNLAQAQLAALKLYSTKAAANKADNPKATPQYVRQVPRHKLVVTCFIGEVDSKSNCSTKCFGEDGVPNQSGKVICGFPGKAAEIEWKFLGYVGDKDVYEFTDVAPRGSPDANTTKSDVKFDGRRTPAFKDSNYFVVLDSPETKAQAPLPNQLAESQPKDTNAAPERKDVTVTVVPQAGAATGSATSVSVVSEATSDSPDLVLRVSNLGGEAVGGARVGWKMKFEGDSFGWPASRFSNIGYARSDIKGAVRLARDDVFGERQTDRREWLYVLQPTQSLVAVVERTRSMFAGYVDVTLFPACRVQAQLQSEGILAAGRAPASYTAYITRAGRRVLTIRSKTGVLEALLPPGDYELESYAWDPGIHQGLGSAEFLHTAPTKRPFTVVQDQTALDLGPIDGSPSRLSRLIGQIAPELPTMQAWSNGGPVSLRELRDNVVVLDFWSWGCQPCLASMPKLIKLREQFEGRAVVILAIHDDSAATFAEVDERCAAARAKLWEGRALPFLLAIDSPAATIVGGDSYVSGKTAADYGIQALPTLLLIDKQGRLRGPVSSESSEELADIIERLLDES